MSYRKAKSCAQFMTTHLLPTPEKDSKFYVAIKRTDTSYRPLIDPCCFKIFLCEKSNKKRLLHKMHCPIICLWINTQLGST